MKGAVLVTGGAKRIGRAIALKLAQQGCKVAVHYRSSREEAMETVRMIEMQGGSAVCIGADLGNISDVENLLESASEAIGSPILGIVNNASMYIHDRLETMNPEVWANHMSVNVYAPLILTNSLSNSGGGWIVNILDYKIDSPNADFLSYTISKFALDGATKTLARDLAPGVRINAVAPGHTLGSDHLDDDELLEAQTSAPLGIGPTPSDVAEAVSYLASAKTVTGQTIYVDGGERFRKRDRDPAFEVI
tara:strand:+ start:510 stop:1256 length:747 start_codon:yes stop_codon:yes gene_type:complete